MPKPRTKDNKNLPRYWRFKHNAYQFRIPEHLRKNYEGQTEILLGHTLHEAYANFSKMHHVHDVDDLGEKTKTLRQLFDKYRIEVVSKHESQNTIKSKNYSLNNLTEVLGDNSPRTLRPTDIYKYRDHIAEVKSKKQANLDLQVLSHVFTLSIEWGIREDHPMTNKLVTKFKLKSRDRYVEDWELQEWSKVANPFLVVYIVLKGLTGLRQQDLLTIRNKDITKTELRSQNIKTGKWIRFPLWENPKAKHKIPTTMQLALELINSYYGEHKSEWLFHTTRKNKDTPKGSSYYNIEESQASGFHSIWRRSMIKAIKLTELEERFTEHDIRAKASSDSDSLQSAQKLLAHSSAQLTEKHYWRKGTLISPNQGFLFDPKTEKWK